MPEATDTELPPLPDTVTRALRDFTDACVHAFRASLESIVLFGSAAEGRLRPASDVNVIVILNTFVSNEADALRQPIRVAHAAAGIEVMFLLINEIHDLAKSFGVKFSDILRVHRVLWGKDPFVGHRVERAALLDRVQQVLFNLRLRLRSQYVTRGLRAEQIADALADAAGPVRSAAAAILELEGKPVTSKKHALEDLAKRVGGDWGVVLHSVTEARETRIVSSTEPGKALLGLIELCERLDAHVKSNLAAR